MADVLILTHIDYCPPAHLAQVLQQQRAFNLVRLWRPLREARTALDAVTRATAGLDHAIAPHPVSGLPVLRVCTADGPALP